MPENSLCNIIGHNTKIKSNVELYSQRHFEYRMKVLLIFTLHFSLPPTAYDHFEKQEFKQITNILRKVSIY